MNDNQDSNMKNKAHIQEVYKDKAIRFLKFCIGIFAFDGFTYLMPFVYNAIGLGHMNAFDFGLIFEVISFVFVLVSIDRLKQNNLQSSKKSIIIAMIPIGWLIIYDFINLLVNIDEVMGEVLSYYIGPDKLFYFLSPYLVDVTLIAIIVFLYKSYLSINKSDGTTPISDNYTDTFYNKL